MAITESNIKDKALSLGADLVGVAPISRWANAPEKLRPQAHLPEAKSVIVMGIHHPDASVEWGGEPNSNYAGPFQIGMIPKLDNMSSRLARFIELHGERAVPLPCTGFWRHRPYKDIDSTNTASFSHRHAAVAAGLGEFGWNNLLLTAKYGPRQRLISVITSADLVPDPLYEGTDLCDNCNMCVKHCPGKNFEQALLLKPGFDTVAIEGNTYKYAKLNRWRCLWGEQFALDMNKLYEYGIASEEDIYKAVDDGIKRLGGEFGSCFRFCMAKPVRYWDRAYTKAPRRKKERKQTSQDELLDRIREFARINGADSLVICPLKKLLDSHVNLPSNYPISRMEKNFSWVIAFGRKVPAFAHGHALLTDCREYIESTTKVRLSIGAYDIAAYLDDLGYEAMQDWMELASYAIKKN